MKVNSYAVAALAYVLSLSWNKKTNALRSPIVSWSSCHRHRLAFANHQGSTGLLFEKKSGITEDEETEKNTNISNGNSKSNNTTNIQARQLSIHHPYHIQNSPPPLPKVKLFRQRVRPNPYNIPTDKNEEWEFFYRMLQDHYTTNNNVDIPAGPAVNQSLLRNWCADQRKSYMKTLGVLDLGEKANWGTEYLTRERKERLDAAGFYWGHLEPAKNDDELFSEEFQSKVRLKYKDWIWNPLYDKLVKFYRDYGHTNVPVSRRDGLGTWAAQQRMSRVPMPARRRKKLDALHFDWDWTDRVSTVSYPPPDPTGDERGSDIGVAPVIAVKRKKITWAQRVRELTQYREQYGNCDVPIDYQDVPGLGLWVKKQRVNKKLSPRSRLQLEKLGFEFTFE